MFRFLIRMMVAFVAIVPLAFVAAIVLIPGPHRVVAPGSFGLTEIGPGIYSDMPERGKEHLATIERSRSDSQKFFGETQVPWRTVLCTSGTCRETFGIPGRAITLADMAILAAPSGLTERTLFHEQIHIEFNARMGILDAIWPRFPSWFNEGLATHLSGTPPVSGPARVTDAQWITAAKTPLGWRLAKRGRTAAEYYGAAKRMVAGIEAEIGQEGLRRLVDAVAEGAEFSAALRSEMGS